jgi:uncharacterized protein YecE (DUF72 family)
VKKNQLSLFGGEDADDDDQKKTTAPPVRVAPLITDEDRAAATSLPSFVRFGTSSWSFPGWIGILYSGKPTETDLARGGLEAYAQHPLFRTVSLDRSYYGPLRTEDLAAYRTQIEASTRARAPTEQAVVPFKMVSKVWDEITTPIFPRHPRYGARAGSKNPNFLNVERFESEVFAPYVASGFLPHAGPFVFEITPMPENAIEERAFIALVDSFISRLPTTGGARWAFELRNAELFGSRWLDMLRANGAAHVFTYWTAMPPLRVQLAAAKKVGLTSSMRFVVTRLMLPPYTKYATRKSDFAPFDKIAAPAPDMRDDVIDILRAAEEAAVDDAFVLVNNKAEGSAPLTIRALATQAKKFLRPNR